MSDKHFDHWPTGLPRTLTLPATSVWENLEVSARRYPEKPALIFFDTPVTYDRLRRDAEAMAGWLQQRCGVKKGDRVMLFAQNSPQFVIAYYAILRADACVVPINPMNRTDELRHFAKDSGATVVIAAQELWSQMKPLLEEGLVKHAVVAAYCDYQDCETDLPLPPGFDLPRLPIAGEDVVLWTDAVGAGLAPSAHTAGPNDLCVMPYTSGTTGFPKGCIHSHRTVQHTLIGGCQWFSTMHPDYRFLAVLPFFHVTGMQNSMSGPLYVGCTIVLLPRWDRVTAGKLIERYKVQCWTSIPTMVVDFLSNPKVTEFDFSSLNRMSGGGAAMPEAIARKLQDTLGITYMEGYGLSETMAPSHINPAQNPKRQCLGIPIFDTESMVVNPDTLQELPTGEVGEIVTCGPQVFHGYWNNAKATEACFFERDGKRFFRTGDLGYVDADGYFFLVDRLKRMINASGLKVWPAEVESMMYGHPDIQEACVISAKDEHRGETVKAVVVLKEVARGKTSADDVIAWAREHMAAYKVPRVIEFAETLPRSATGKVQWRVLQEQEDARG